MSAPGRDGPSGPPSSPRPRSPPPLSEMVSAPPRSRSGSDAAALSPLHSPVLGPRGASDAPVLSPRRDAVPGPAPAPPVALAPAPLPRPRVPLTIDGRPAVHAGNTGDGRRVFNPLRDAADPAKGTSPYPHYTAAADGGPGHLSDMSVHVPPTAPSTVARMRQTYTAPLGGPSPANRTDRYVDQADGVPQRRAAGVFTPQDEPPLSPRTSRNAAPRTGITFEK